MDQIPLNRAVICINCNTIFRISEDVCPHCAVTNFVPISKWLDRSEARVAKIVTYKMAEV